VSFFSRFHWSRFLFCNRFFLRSFPGLSSIGVFLFVAIVLGIGSNRLMEQNLVSFSRQRRDQKLTISFRQIGKQRLAATLSMHPCVPMIAFNGHADGLGSHDTASRDRMGIRESGLRIRKNTLLGSHANTSCVFSSTSTVQSEMDISAIGIQSCTRNAPRESIEKSASEIVVKFTVVFDRSTHTGSESGSDC